MAIVPLTDLGGHVKSLYGGCTNTAGAPIVVVAAGAGDGVAITGATIDRLNFESAVVVLPFLAALQQDETLTISSLEYQESADGSSWDTAVSIDASEVVATGDTGGSNESGQLAVKVDLESKKRYIRFNFTPDLSAGATDTAIVASVVVLGGAKRTSDADNSTFTVE